MANNCECEPRLVDDFEGVIKVYSDGSIVREVEISLPLPLISEECNVLHKDLVFDEEVGLWARLYLPNTMTTTMSRVPVCLYFHASGFCLLSPADPGIHRLCELWAAKLGVIIISVKYRLAPEHRLPAAYDDAIAGLKWLQGQALALKTEGAAADPWLRSHADFSKIFLMGESAGGNIAHHLGMWAAGNGMEIEMEIKGMILLYPAFGGEDRLPSEGAGLSLATVESTDIMWRMALPVGSKRDHPFCNPVGDGSVTVVSSLALPPMLFVIAGRDLLKDKILQYCEFVKKSGKNVEVVLFEEEYHGFPFSQVEVHRQSSVEVQRCISHFIESNTS